MSAKTEAVITMNQKKFQEEPFLLVHEGLSLMIWSRGDENSLCKHLLCGTHTFKLQLLKKSYVLSEPFS